MNDTKSETPEFDIALAAIYVMSERLKQYAIEPSGHDAIAPIRTEVQHVLLACAESPSRKHTDEEYDAVINSGLNLLKQLANAIEEGAIFPSEIIEASKVLFRVCVKADLISLDEL